MLKALTGLYIGELENDGDCCGERPRLEIGKAARKLLVSDVWARGRGPTDTARLLRGAMAEAMEGESMPVAASAPGPAPTIAAPMRARRTNGVDGAELAVAEERGALPDAERNMRRLRGRLSASVSVRVSEGGTASANTESWPFAAAVDSGESLAAATAAASSGEGAEGGDAGGIAAGDERTECAGTAGDSKLAVQGSDMRGPPSSPAVAAAICEGEARGASSSDAAAAAPAPSAAVDIIAMTLRGE